MTRAAATNAVDTIAVSADCRVRRTPGVPDLAVHIHHTVSGMPLDETNGIFELRRGRRGQIDNRDVAIDDLREYTRLGQFGGEIENRDDSALDRFRGFSIGEPSSDPQARCHLVIGTALPLVVRE